MFDSCIWIPRPINGNLFVFFTEEAEKSEDSSGAAGLSSLQRTYSQDCSFKNSMYHVGDYVYVEPAEASLQPHIVCIERLWEDSAGKCVFNRRADWWAGTVLLLLGPQGRKL